MFVRACSDYLDVIRGLRERADQLQISREAIDDLSGLSDGYSAKLLSIPPVKTIGFMSMSPLFETLGVRLMLVEDTEHTAKTLTRRTPRVEGHVRTGHVRQKPQPDLAVVKASNGTENINMGTGTAYPIAAGAAGSISSTQGARAIAFPPSHHSIQTRRSVTRGKPYLSR